MTTLVASSERCEHRLGESLAERFAIRRVLGENAAWRAYSAFDRELQYAGVLHVVRADASAYARRLETAQRWHDLDEPNVARVLELSQHPDGFFAFVEQPEGVPLSRWLAAERHREAVVALFRELARTIASCHEHGLVWGNLDPEHIYIDAFDRPHIVGAPEGLSAQDPCPALATEPSRELLRRNYAKAGWPGGRYVAPEQEARVQVDRRSDQYAWAAVFWEALTGTPPFRTSFERSLFADKLQGIRPSSQIDRRLTKLLVRALSPLPQRRWPTMNEVVRRLGRSRSHPITWGLGLAACTALMIGGVTVAPEWKSLRCQLTACAEQPGHAPSQEPTPPDPEPERGCRATESQYGARSPAYAQCLSRLAETEASEQPERAREYLQRLIAVVEDCDACEPDLVPTTVGSIAATNLERGRVEPAIAVLKTALSRVEPRFRSDLWQQLGDVLTAGGRPETALRAYEQAVTNARVHDAPPQVFTQLIDKLLAGAETPELERLRVVVVAAEHGALPSARRLGYHADYAERLLAEQRYAAAGERFQRIVVEALDVPDIARETLATWGEQGSVALHQADDAAGAIALLERVHDATATSSFAHARVSFALARILWAAGRDETRAITIAEQALETLGNEPRERTLRRDIEQWFEE